jgi:hypothetical protein
MGGSLGVRIDNIDFEAAGPTPTASTLRLFYAPGNAGLTVSSVSVSTVTATVTTVGNHGLSTNMVVYTSGFVPIEYNGIFTVTSTPSSTSFTFVMPVAPTIPPSVIGTYTYAIASPALSLLREVAITQIASPSATTPVWNGNLNTNSNPDIFPIVLPPGYSLRASMNDIQIVAQANPVSICASQSVASSNYAVINGSLAVAASTAAIGALQTLGGAGYMSLTATPYTLTNYAQVTLTSAGNISAVNFTIIGTDATGALLTETIAGPNNTTVYFANIYVSVLQVYANGAVGTNTSIGYSAVAPLAIPSKILLTSSANLSAVTFTIKGTLSNGTVQFESLLGPAIATSVQSANTYRSITSIFANALANPLLVGAPMITTPVKVTPRGGAF